MFSYNCANSALQWNNTSVKRKSVYSTDIEEYAKSAKKFEESTCYSTGGINFKKKEWLRAENV